HQSCAPPGSRVKPRRSKEPISITVVCGGMHPGRRGDTSQGDDRSERQRHAALPGDVVLGLVEAVSVELVNQVPPLRADADAAQAVFDSRAEVAGELGPGAIRLELMDADRAQSAEYIWRNRGRPGLERVPQ